MIISSNITLTKPLITTLACLSTNSNSNTNSNNNTTPSNKPQKIATLKHNTRSKTNNQPSLAEVEQAIGAGIYRDFDPDSGTGENRNVFDVVLSNTIGKTEGETERKLRETGEWLNAQTEKSSGSLGKKILQIMFFWILPAWFLLFFVATGVIKLPSTFSALNDFIM
ncbi:hypothetical protein RND81_02G082500 [Saponaria officinalis]|uniref:Chlororespiratory reduction 3 n=1 Tax=Saponaria officinalis TaxID=3572 RepID=A0AAW1MS96_SAPOF